MVATKVVSLYVGVWELIQADDFNWKDLLEFNRKLPLLRKALSCSVCSHLLTNRKALSPSTCQEHFVCRDCLGKDRLKNHKCNQCESWDVFKEDKILDTVTGLYQRNCYSTLTDKRFIDLVDTKHEPDANFDAMKLIKILEEGLQGFKLGAPLKRSYVNCLLRNLGLKPSIIQERPLEVRPETSKATSTSGVTTSPEKATANNVATSISRDIAVLKETSNQNFTSAPDESELPAKRSRISSSIEKNAGQQSPLIASSSSPVSSTPTTSNSVAVSSTITRQNDQIVIIKEEAGSRSTVKPRQEPTFIIRNISRDSTPNQSPTKPLVSSPSTTNPSFTGARLVMTGPKVISGGLNAPAPGSQLIRIAGPGSSGSSIQAIPTSVLNLLKCSKFPIRVITAQSGASTSSTTTVSGSGDHSSVQNTVTFLQTSGNVTGTSSSAGNTKLTTSTSVPTSANLNPPSAAVPRRQLYVPTTLTAADLQRTQWPDPNQVLQFHAQDVNISQVCGMRPCAHATSSTSGGKVVVSTGTLDSRNTYGPAVRQACPPTSTMISGSTIPQQLQQGGQVILRTVPNMQTQGAPMGVQIVRGALNSQTIQSVSDASQFLQSSCHSSSSSASSSPVPGISKRKGEGCRCGSATQNPGKLTCIGQRCACYADKVACNDCKCKGCKNPYIPGSTGNKILPQSISYLTTASIPSSANSGMNPSMIANIQGATTSSASTPTSVNLANVQTVVGSPSNFQSGTTVQYIPVRIGTGNTTQIFQLPVSSLPFLMTQSSTGAGAPQLSASGPTRFTIQGIPTMSGLPATSVPVSHIQQQRFNMPQTKPEDRGGTTDK